MGFASAARICEICRMALAFTILTGFSTFTNREVSNAE